MTDKFLPYGRQVIDNDDIAAVVTVLKGDFLTTGPTVEKFEDAFAERAGARFAVACSSGTAALHLATLAAGLGEGDSAIVPTVTFLATANAVRYVGADVVFADVDKATGLLRPEDMEAALAASAGNVKAVLPVHLGGQSADMAAISKIAERHGMVVIEDACHALGTTLDDGGVVGNCQHSAMAAFSFHPVKTIAMGEGGAVTTNDPVLYERLTRLRNHGMTRDPLRFSNDDLAFGADGSSNPWYYEMPEIGFNYRASDIHCALGLSQLRKLSVFVSTRRLLADTYDRLLAPLAPYVLPPHRVEGCNPGWHLYAVRMDFSGLEISREQVISKLKAAGVGTQVHYVPVHTQPYYRDLVGPQQLPGAMAYYRATLSLPLFPSMTISDVERVVKAIEDVVHPGSKK
ncbi:4-keto-6-deoxy-N-Acetyl-D-hexosaminyl-(lipid carrier) aminotransferase [Bradyrhizobiaceae bacterium SG-6C]|nr:4-keto-6-deoxy-N-Acetyl-D-hexosaminyl-(lipid carrier) aminotransferase [Bradyrhizobiaceae bacterium SG-6C]